MSFFWKVCQPLLALKQSGRDAEYYVAIVEVTRLGATQHREGQLAAGCRVNPLWGRVKFDAWRRGYPLDGEIVMRIRKERDGEPVEA